MSESYPKLPVADAGDLGLVANTGNRYYPKLSCSLPAVIPDCALTLLLVTAALEFIFTILRWFRWPPGVLWPSAPLQPRCPLSSHATIVAALPFIQAIIC